LINDDLLCELQTWFLEIHEDQRRETTMAAIIETLFQLLAYSFNQGTISEERGHLLADFYDRCCLDAILQMVSDCPRCS
jgi:hypothetical protein